VQQSGGAVVNFIGDAILAVFNVPLELENPADAALECYRSCRANLNTTLKERKKVSIAGCKYLTRSGADFF
jgi:class 3 adenylate cyclase